MIMKEVRNASPRDKDRVLALLHKARRSFATFGAEDLGRLLAGGHCIVAATGQESDPLAAFVAATIDPSDSPPTWAHLRSVAIADHKRTDQTLPALLESLIDQLSRQRVTHLVVFSTAPWLEAPLMQAGFQRLDSIITLKRHARPLPAAPAPAALRPVAAADLERLVTLDQAAFEPPYQMSRGDLAGLMVTCGQFAVAELGGSQPTRPPAPDAGRRAAKELAGYICADVLDDDGQVIRLAVHPRARRQGLGRQLLNQALTYCQAQGARTVLVNTQASNAASLCLYETTGFRRLGRPIPVLVRPLHPA